MRTSIKTARGYGRMIAVIGMAAMLTMLMGGHAFALPGKCVRYHEGGVSDGLTWATAFKTVKDAVNASVSGDEIWVAAGTYVENVVLPSGIALYGGFGGTETLRTQRNWINNVTVIDGNSAGPVVEVVRNATAATRIDGFTITNGRAMVGGGVYCNQSASPVIINNIIKGNSADFEGGGVYCNLSSSPVIANNQILNNGAMTAGGGVCNKTGSPTVTNNVIAGNSARVGGGICLGDTSTATSEPIRNNTIVANAALYGGGINCRALSSASISNNIVAFNSGGIRVESGTGTPVLTKNCVSGNDVYNYNGISQGTSDITSDPQLASAAFGNFHIQPTSPCRNTGNNGHVISGYLDIDNQTRIQNATVDIGADESDGTTWAVNPTIVRVAPTGDDSNNGSSWALAKRTIEAATDAVAASLSGPSNVGGEVWVKVGTYNENVVLRDYVYVYGGFAGTETAKSQRNWATNVTTVDGQAGGSVVTANLMGYRVGAIDGFKLQNGRGWNGAGVFCSNASPVVMNNNIVSNSAAGNGAGVYLANSVALVKANQVKSNSSLGYGGGVNCHYSRAEVSRNSIESNSACVTGCGAFSSRADQSTFVNNLIIKNAQNSVMAGAQGIAMSVDSYSNPTMICNTIADNGPGNWVIYSGVYGRVTMYSNILAFNSSGIKVGTGATVTQVASFSGDPLFVNRAAGNYKLLGGSPCIDAADAATAPTEDFDGNPRPVDGDLNGSSIADIGCYEYGSAVPELPAAPTSVTATPSSLCSNAPVVLHANGGSGITLRWLTGGCDGTPVGTGNDLVVYPMETTTYYARWETSLGNSTCASATVTITGVGPIATVGGPQSISALGTTTGLGGNVPTPPATGAWSLVSGGAGTFSSATDPNATFTHTGGEGPFVLRWTVSSPPCAPATADVIVTLGYFCLRNADFEGGFTDGAADYWIKATPVSGTWARETSIRHSGSASQKIVDVVGTPAFTSWLYQQVSVKPGRYYVPSMWLYRVGGTIIRIGIDPNGGTSFVSGDAAPTPDQWTYRENDAFLSGNSGLVSIGIASGYNSGSGTAYFDDVAIKPQAPQSSGGTATISYGGTATITAGGGFGGDSSELCWYTGSGGTGIPAGSGTSLVVSPTVTTTYYPRWETGGECGISDDGSPVTITVLAPAPTISSIVPSSGMNTGTLSDVDLEGANFVSGAAVKLARTGCSDIIAADVVVTSPNQIICAFDLDGKQTGLWNVIVQNPDMQSGTLENGFGVGISSDSPVFGVTIASLLHPITVPAAQNQRFCVWGRVETISPSLFWLDDGSGANIKVFAPGYSGIADGDYASASGTVDVVSGAPVLVSDEDLVVKYN